MSQIESIEIFVEAIQDKFPNLKHLSLLRNPCCPNYFVGKDSAAYQKYRFYVAARLPNLKYLDSSPVTDKERLEGNKSYARVARPDPSQYQKKAEDPVIEESLGLPVDDPASQQKKTTYGVTRYVYVGRQSEGNRFIVDQQL
jgi:leucine-rich melanocyte differentiation-associated protein